jgi:hypothetical protein
MKISKKRLNKLIERFLFENDNQNKLKSSYAIVCYSNSDYAGKAASAVVNKFGGKVEKDDYNNPKDWWTNEIPQGHAWMILINKNGNTCVCEFGSESCDYKDSKDVIDDAMIYLAKAGVPLVSKTKIRNQWLEDVKGDKLTTDIVGNLIKQSLKVNRSVNKKVYKINSFDKAYKAAGTDGECRLYNLIPFDVIPGFVKTAARAAGYSLESLRFHNCGSYVANVLAEATGTVSISDAVDISTFPGTILEIFDDNIPSKYKTKIVNDEYV